MRTQARRAKLMIENYYSNLLLHPSARRGLNDKDVYAKETSSTKQALPLSDGTVATQELDDGDGFDVFDEADNFFMAKLSPDEPEEM